VSSPMRSYGESNEDALDNTGCSLRIKVYLKNGRSNGCVCVLVKLLQNNYNCVGIVVDNEVDKKTKLFVRQSCLLRGRWLFVAGVVRLPMSACHPQLAPDFIMSLLMKIF